MLKLHLIDLAPNTTPGEESDTRGDGLMSSKGYYCPVTWYDLDDRETEFPRWFKSLTKERLTVEQIVIVTDQEGLVEIPMGVKTDIPVVVVKPELFCPNPKDIVWLPCGMHLRDVFYMMTDTHESYEARLHSPWFFS